MILVGAGHPCLYLPSNRRKIKMATAPMVWCHSWESSDVIPGFTRNSIVLLMADPPTFPHPLPFPVGYQSWLPGNPNTNSNIIHIELALIAMSGEIVTYFQLNKILSCCTFFLKKKISLA